MLAALALTLTAAAPPRVEAPLPVDRSRTLTSDQDGGTFTVEGRVTIPRGVHVSCQRGTRVVGRGEGAVLVVEGTLSVVGTRDMRCAVRYLTIELAPGFKAVRLSEADVVDVGVRTAEGRPASEGILLLDGCRLTGSTAVDVESTDGELQFLSTSHVQPLKVTGLPVPVGERLTDNRTSLFLSGGTIHGLDVRGVAKVRVRHARLTTSLALADCTDLMVDGCRLDLKQAVVEHSEPAGLKRTRFTKCDFYLDELVVRAPGSKRSTVTVDKPYFRGCDDEGDVRAKVLRDGADDERNGARVVLKKLRDEPNGFAN